jgi:ribonucleoside-diphosphate reductase alpha chain
VVIRATDTMDDLREKVRLATILGTLQSTLTNFRYIRAAWKANCEEERLLGQSMTGIVDNELTNGRKSGLEDRLKELKQIAIDTNAEWAKMLGINPATAITAVKPSGTVSQLVNAGSGIHARNSKWGIRTFRADKKDPVSQMMIDHGFPYEDDVMAPDSTYVFSFPIKAPKGAICKNDMNAIEQLELWLMYQRHWCEHKPSCTISVKEPEWLQVGSWVYDHFDEMSGISFLPYDDHVYKQAPFQECTKEEYEEMVKKMPTDGKWDKLYRYESSDQTIGSQELACSAAGGCEI